MLLSGYTGLFSLGHAAFLGVGAYTEAALGSAGWPFPLSFAAAALVSAAAGVVVGLPALRVKGIYLAIATLAFGFIVVEVFARWESVTGGNAGKHLKPPQRVRLERRSTTSRSTSSASSSRCCATLAILNLLRSPTGRAFVAIRDSEVSAQSMGIHLARYKTLSFAISAALAGVGGALYAHKLKFISPDQFDIIQSIDLVLMIVVGGIGSVHGAFLGAIFLITMPQVIALAKDVLPAVDRPGARAAGRGLRLRPDRLRPVRAARPLRPLAEAAHLPADLSVLPPRHVQAPEELPQVGPAEMTTRAAPLLSVAAPRRPLRRRPRRRRRQLRRRGAARCSR